MNQETMESLSARLDRIERNTLLGAKRVLTVEDVACLAGITKRSVYRLTNSKTIPYYRPNGKEIYFDREEVERWLLSNRHSTDEELRAAAVTKSVTRNMAWGKK